MFEQWRIPITVIPLCLVCHAVGRNLSRNLKFKSENQHDKTDRQVIPDSIRAVSFLELVQLVWRSVHAGVPPLTISSTSEIFSTDSRSNKFPAPIARILTFFFAMDK